MSVEGYLVLDKVHKDEPDGTLYLERESARMGIGANAISVRFGACAGRISLSGEKLVKADPELLPQLPGYVVVHGIFEPRAEGSIVGGGVICGITWLIRKDDPEQGVGAKSWWNSVARPLSSAPPWHRSSGAAGRGER
jgi:hypothetical protein